MCLRIDFQGHFFVNTLVFVAGSAQVSRPRAASAWCWQRLWIFQGKWSFFCQWKSCQRTNKGLNPERMHLTHTPTQHQTELSGLNASRALSVIIITWAGWRTDSDHMESEFTDHSQSYQTSLMLSYLFNISANLTINRSGTSFYHKK